MKIAYVFAHFFSCWKDQTIRRTAQYHIVSILESLSTQRFWATNENCKLTFCMLEKWGLFQIVKVILFLSRAGTVDCISVSLGLML